MTTDNERACVESIHIADAGGAPLRELQAANLIADRGIDGDRYCAAAGPTDEAQVSLVEAERIEDFAREAGIPIRAGDTRRNIVTRGIALNDLVGRQFAVGEAELIGTELAEPCAYLARRLIGQFEPDGVAPKDIVAGLVGRAGIYARVVRGGTIRPGDRIAVAR